jgi:Mn-containing catalase
MKNYMNQWKKTYLKNINHQHIEAVYLVQKYKEEYVKKHKNKNYYSGTKENSNLKRWFNEKWQNQRGEIGYQKKTDVYRPTIRINDKTPTTFNELTKNQIKKAMNEKARTRRVKQILS